MGASDDLARGRSTFMVEMTETARDPPQRDAPLARACSTRSAAARRTFDGVSIAWAVAEHLHDRVGCRTLFATHYHELQDLARERPAVRNLTVAVREVGEQVVFLRKLVQGGASRSYGIEVAKLAGLPGGGARPRAGDPENLEALEVDEGGHAALARGRKARSARTRRASSGSSPATAPADPAARRDRGRRSARSTSTRSARSTR